MTADWADLDQELEAWGACRGRACFWWRDDDLEAPSPALDRLLELRADAPIALAVIPKSAKESLAVRLGECPALDILQHGFAHANHSRAGEKKSEFGAHRPATEAIAELSAGRQILADMFGDRFLPVLAPPWNRISGALAERLGDAGLVALSGFGNSTFGPLPNFNTHIDPIAWRTTRRFAGTGAVLAQILATLRKRRSESAMAHPIGLLTHHRQMDEEGWTFVDQFVKTLQAHPNVTLKSIGEILAASPTQAPDIHVTRP